MFGSLIVLFIGAEAEIGVREVAGRMGIGTPAASPSSAMSGPSLAFLLDQEKLARWMPVVVLVPLQYSVAGWPSSTMVEPI